MATSSSSALLEYNARCVLRSAGSLDGEDVDSEFIASQVLSQAATLASNTQKRDSAEVAGLVVENHRKALKFMMEQAAAGTALTVELLCRAHWILCEGLFAGSGALRTMRVKVDTRTSCDPEMVATALEATLRVARGLLERPPEVLPVFGAAAAVTLGFFEVHPFIDGNGRLGRLVANFVLRQRGVPFPVALCATPAQRADYTAAVRLCLEGATAAPFADLLAGACARAWHELGRLSAQRTLSSAESATARALRDARASARQGACLVCLEPGPDVGALCCGAALHLRCLAEWVSSAPEPHCVQCREPLTRPSVRPPPPQPPSDAGEDGTTAEDFTSTTDTSADAHGDTTSIHDDTTSFHDDTTSFHDDTTSFHDDTTSFHDDTTSFHDDTTSAGHDDTTTADDGSLPLPPPPPQHQPRPHCYFDCGSLAAGACANQSCGACCASYGEFSCARHNT